mmetsp:Transcript_69819/g.202367  ORF Transcript_69819/g.202367 Transcript_69819/m.202367 type:complete len:210 (+) Transcript_69819:960-1589(+)
MAPASSKEPLRPPFHSLTRTPRNKMVGWPSKFVSACCALSPHKVTCMLRPVWSPTTISRFTSSLPACDVNEKDGLKLTMTPHTSTVHGNAFIWIVCKSAMPSWARDRDVKLALLPDSAHHCRTRCASRRSESKTMTPACSKEPLRPPLNSFTVTPLRHTKGFPSKALSSLVARSPQRATTMLVAVSSATVISRLTSSRPACDVNGTGCL